ncbi:MAG: hypothetical protein ACPG66_00100 [Flavobacteriales bacterium]
MHNEKGEAKPPRTTWNDIVRRIADSQWGGLLWGTSWRQLHSPTLFEMGKALQPNPHHWPRLAAETWTAEGKAAMEAARKKFLESKALVTRRDLGAGSRRTRGESAVRVCELAQKSLTPTADLEALCRWLQVVAPIERKGRFLELGTSLGLTSAGVASLGWEVQTWEGCPATLELATQMWKELGLSADIDAREGDFRTLVKELRTGEAFDVVYLDGLHEERATLELVSVMKAHVVTCLVVDDISWSAGMNRAWQSLQCDPVWRVSFTWRGRGFLLKAPHMARAQFRLA